MQKTIRLLSTLFLLLMSAATYGQHKPQGTGAAGETKEVKAEQQTAAEWAEKALEGLSQLDQLILLNLAYQANRTFKSFGRSPEHIFNPQLFSKQIENPKVTKLAEELNQILDTYNKEQAKINAAGRLTPEERELNRLYFLSGSKEKSPAIEANRKKEETLDKLLQDLDEATHSQLKAYYNQLIAKSKVPRNQMWKLAKMVTVTPGNFRRKIRETNTFVFDQELLEPITW